MSDNKICSFVRATFKLACRGHNCMINLSRVQCHLKMTLFRSRVVEDLSLANQKVSRVHMCYPFSKKKTGTWYCPICKFSDQESRTTGCSLSVFMASASRTQKDDSISWEYFYTIFHEWHPPSQVFCLSHPHPTAA